MLRITNLTDKEIIISKNIILKSRSYIDVQSSIDSRLYQLMNMNIIKIQEISEKPRTSNENTISEGSLRRKQMMERIRRGETKPGVSLDVSLYKQTTNTSEEKLKRGRRNK
jgi:hypothetical protein